MTILRGVRFPSDPRVAWIGLAELLGLASALACAQATGTVDPQGTEKRTIIYKPHEPADILRVRRGVHAGRPQRAEIELAQDSGVGAPEVDFGAPEQTESAGTRAVDPVVYLPREVADPNSLSSLLWVRHDYGEPEVMEMGGNRGNPEWARPVGGLPDILVLAPPKLAHSLSPQPTLYWYVSGPSNVPVRLTVLDVEAASPEPVLELEIGTVPAAGVYATSLTEHGVHLEPGHRYEWSVALEVNPEAYSEEPVARTIFANAEADPTLLTKIADGPALARIEALAAAGYWYDALDLLAQQIAAGDQSQPWRELSAALLEQARLQRVAAFARGDRGVQ